MGLKFPQAILDIAPLCSPRPPLQLDMPTGVVKKWNGDRGFGFIAPDDGSEELFVHMRALQNGHDYLTDVEAVEYEAEWDEQKGKMGVIACSGGMWKRRPGSLLTL